MAATDMKFGPEWLRALSDGVPNSQTQTPPTTPAPPKYKLAEYRYGREEMLALFNSKCKPPEKLEEFPHIFVEKMQPPLAFITMTEEEQRLWSRQVNSDVVLRLMGKSGGSGPERERGVSERGGVSLRAGRGGSLSERGGRGRGRGYYQRGTSYDDGGDSPPERRDFRTRPFDRNAGINDDNTNSREKKYERSFSRGGGSGGGAEDNSLSNRKNNNSRSSSVENWRTAGRGEDREGWRTASRPQDSWNRNNSWRSGDRERDYEHENEPSERNGPHKKYSNYQKDKNSSDLWDDIDENDRRNSLPEWSLDDGPECDAKVGTFDASGAFREINNDEEDNKSDNPEDEQNDRQEDSEQWTNVDKSRKKTNSSQNTKQNNNESPKETKSENINQNSEKLNKSDERNNNENIKGLTHISNNSQQQQQQQQKHQIQQQLNQQMPQQSQPSSTTTLNKLLKVNDTSNQHNIKSPLEEDGFTHLEKEAENMVAQWTAEEDQKDEPEMEANNKNIIVLPVHHEDAFKWFYRDPQREIQGPFTPHEMYDWFTAGYFAMDLLVRRGCDEVFSQLGELFKLWERIPFLQVQGATPPPIRSASSNPSLSSNPIPLSSVTHSSHNIQPHQHLLQQQFQQQQQQQQQQPQYMSQHIDMQSQLRQLLAQLKKQEGFSDLSQQQQQEVLVQRYVNLERQRQAHQSSIPNTRTAEDSQLSQLDALTNLRIQGQRPLHMVNNSGHVTSVWDMNPNVMSVSAVEEMQRKEQERKELEEKRKAYEEEQNRRKLEQEELQRKLNEERERKYEELQKKLEEERLRNQELVRKQDEERRRREEEERLRLEEEHNRIEEERRIVEEQRRRQEELMRLEEYARRQQKEEAERRRQVEMEKERQRQQLQELEQQRAKDIERIRQIQQQEAIIKLQQQQQQEANRKVWGVQEQTQRQQQTPLSLNEIQRLQEEKEREERQRQIQIQQQQMQALFAAREQQQQQQNKQNLTWATPSYQQQNAPVKTLAEIQREEAEKVAKQKQVEHKKQQKQVTNNVPNAGIWNNANNQLFGQTIAGKPTNSSNSSAIGFWEPESRKVQTNRANESALNAMQSNTKGNNHSHSQTKSNSRNKKDEETVLRLFENQRRQKTDEFTQWCNEALSKLQSSVDIPTFIAFLKDVESPFEINDYVRSYLGDGKDVKDFAKQFIERRSYFRNQAKKEASEELMWGPAPAITPSANKLTQSPLTNQITGDTETSGFIQAGKKKKKGKRVIDNSILGFTVQADPDRINAGEIEQIDD